MEFSSINYRSPTKREIEIKEENKVQIATASKNISYFLLKMTDLCFDKCIDLNTKYMTKYENKCVDSCFKKYVDANEYSYNKFYHISRYKGDESDNYDNLNEILKYFFTISSIEKNRKTHFFHE